MATACITGATAGIGRAFAEILAEQGYDLILVARHPQRLREAADRLSNDHGVAVEVISADLATDSGCAAVTRRLSGGPGAIDLLVNNAGLSVNQGFVAGSLSREEYLLDVLVRAPLRLTHAVLPGMVQRGHGTVVNVSSVAGWLPMGTYSAAKSWVTVFTESLGVELAGSGVTVTALCPGLTRTEFHDRAALDLGSLPTWAWLPPRTVAAQGLADARAGRAISVPAARYRWLSLVIRWAPRPALRRLVARTSGVRRSEDAPSIADVTGTLKGGIGQ